MNDKELADKVVALGIVKAQPMAWHLLDSDGDVIAVFTQERLLLCDWRVAGALIEKFNYYEFLDVLHSIGAPGHKQEAHMAKINPRSIIEACVEVLT